MRITVVGKGNVGGGLARMLERAGLPAGEAESWQSRVEAGAVLVGAHTDNAGAHAAREALRVNGAAATAHGVWA